MTLEPRRRMPPPTKLPDVHRPLWWRLASVAMVAYYRWCIETIEDELEGHRKREKLSGGSFKLGKVYLHNCQVQREALREKIAYWNR